ncbi:MAG: copper homeostasis membrane protein CopD [Caldimonas sp.]
MESLTVATHAIHFAACIALFGELAFFRFVALPCLRSADALVRAALHRRLVAVAGGWLAVAVASGGIWLAIQVVAMSGEPLERALRGDSLGALLAQTLFGNVWLVRGGLCLAVGALLARAVDARHDRVVLGASACLASALLASLALAGHGNAERGSDRIVHLAADVFHLLAAGAWLGALVPLADLLTRGGHRDGEGLDLERAVGRFSSLGIVSVAVLLGTGIVNAGYTVGTLSALFASRYGQLLLVKLGLLVAMLAFAAVNRLRLAPLLADPIASARALASGRLRRNTVAEAILGVGILFVVAALGVSLPAIHG